MFMENGKCNFYGFNRVPSDCTESIAGLVV